jgi:hypothetical protein
MKERKEGRMLTETQVLDVLRGYKEDKLTLDEAKNSLLDLFHKPTQSLLIQGVSDELSRRLDIIDSETDDFTRRCMISNLTIDLL